jgi:hypothetical protein
MEELIKFETAELAKQKGFNEQTIDWFEKRGDNWVEEYPPSYDFGYSTFNDNEKTIARPTQSMLQKWLREDCKIHLTIHHYKNGLYSANLTDDCDDTIGIELFGEAFKTYELALEAGLKEGVKKIKEKV